MSIRHYGHINDLNLRMVTRQYVYKNLESVDVNGGRGRLQEVDVGIYF